MEATLAYLDAQRGRLFDPGCGDALVRGREQLEQICAEHSTASARPGMGA